MSDFKNKIYYLVSGHIPSYIVSEYPQFVNFLEAYYKFLEIEGDYSDETNITYSNPNNLLLNLDSWIDIENTLDIFIKQIRKQQSFDIPETALLDSKRIIKYIHHYYEGKGSENSAELFFRFMFNEKVSVSYPGDYVLRASDGKWKRKTFLKLDTTNFTEDPFDLKKKQIKLRFVDNVATIGKQLKTLNVNCVDVIKKVGTSLYTLEVELDESYEFPDTIVAPGQVTETIGYLGSIAGLAPSTYSASGFDINGDGNTDTIQLLDLYYDTFIYVVYNQKIYGALTKQLVSVETIDVDGSNFKLDDSYKIQEKTAYFIPSTDVVGNFIYLNSDTIFDDGDLVQLTISNVLPNNEIVEKPPFTGVPGGGTGVTALGYYFIKRSSSIPNAFSLNSTYNHVTGSGNTVSLNGSSVYGLNLSGSTIRRKLTLVRYSGYDLSLVPQMIDRKNDAIIRITQTNDIGANQGINKLEIVDTGSKFISRKLSVPDDINLEYFSGDYIADPSYVTELKTIIPVKTTTIAIEPKYPRKSGEVSYVTFNTSPILRQQGFFKDSSGFLSDVNKLQDNYLYQPYSYVIKTQTPQDKWKDVYLKSNHPAGFKLFSELQYIDTIPVTTVIEDIKTLQLVLSDTTTVTDTGITLDIGKFLFNEDYNLEGYFEGSYVVGDGTAISDTVSTLLT